MNSKKLYYEDIYLYEISTKIVDVKKIDDRYHYLLEETIFYPSGGGMSHDLGFINDLEVIDVYKKGDEIYHVLEKEIDGIVKLKIDVDYRIKSCQIHSTQHLITAILEKEFDIKTLSHHVYDCYADLDLDKEVSKQQLIILNEKIEHALFNNYDYSTFLITKDELSKYNIQDNDKYVEPIRIVNIEHINDYNPCGCLHVTNLYQIGQICVFKQEKISRGYRLYFSAGKMLNDYFTNNYKLLNDIYSLTKSNKDSVIDNIDSLMNKNVLLNNNLSIIKSSYFINCLENNNQKLFVFDNDLFDFKDYQSLSKDVLNYSKDIIVYFYKKLNDEYQFMLCINNKNNLSIEKLYDYLNQHTTIKGGKSNYNINGKASINLESLIKDYLDEIL